MRSCFNAACSAAGRLADPLAVALALNAVPPALAPREALRPADVGAVPLAQAGADELVALRQAVPRFRHPRRPHLCARTQAKQRCTHHVRNKIFMLATKNSGTRAIYSLRPKISVVFASQEITLTKYIIKNINIYNT